MSTVVRVVPVILQLLVACAPRGVELDEPHRLVASLAIGNSVASHDPVLTVPRPQPRTGIKEIDDKLKPEEVDPADPRVVAQQAAQRLSALGVAAFPALVESIGDPRQSITCGHYSPSSVGMACWRILLGQVHEGPWGSSYYTYSILPAPEDDVTIFRRWLDERRGWSLREFTIEDALYCLALSRYDGDKELTSFYEEFLSKEGVTDRDAKLAPFVRLTPTLALPETLPELIDLLHVQGGTALELRFAMERAARARVALHDRGEAAFPFVLAAIDRIAMKAQCLDLLRWFSGDDRLIGADLNELTFVTPERALAWRTSHPSGTLKEFRRAASAHALEAMKSLNLKNEARVELESWLGKRLAEVERE